MPLLALLIYITVTYLPLIYKFVPFLGQIKIALVTGIVLLTSFVATHKNYSNSTAYKNPIVYCWAGFLFFMILGILVSEDRGNTLSIIRSSLKCFLVFLVMIKIVDSPKRLEKVLLTFTLCGIGMGMAAIYNNYVFKTHILTEPQSLMGVYRATALEGDRFSDPNDLALLLNTVLPFAIYFLLVKQKKILSLLGVLIITTGIVLTYSRAGFLGLCIIGLAFLLLFGKTQKKYVILILGVAILLWSFAPEGYKERISTIITWKVDETTGMTGTRMDNWRMMISEGLNHLILGVGAGSGIYVSGVVSKDWHSIHNAFVQVFLEIGIFGFMAYLLLFIIPIGQYKSFIKNSDNHFAPMDIFYKMIITSLITFASTAFFTPQAYSPLLYTLTGIAIIGSELVKKQLNSPVLCPTNSPEYQSTVRELKGARL